MKYFLALLLTLISGQTFACSNLTLKDYADASRKLDSFIKSPSSTGHAQNEANYLFQHIPELEETIVGKRVLDVGAGLGYKSQKMRDKGAHVYCVEPQDVYANHILKSGFCDKNNVYKTLVEELPSPLWSTFDVVTSFYVPYNLYVEPGAAFSFFSSVYRMLRDDGQFIATFSRDSNASGVSELDSYEEDLKLFFPNYVRELRPYYYGSDETVIFAKVEPLNFEKVKRRQRQLL